MSDTQQLFQEVNALHGANVVNAQKTAQNAIIIGVKLHQIKEKVGYGGFLPEMEKHAPTITTRCSQNYMRLAYERLVEEKARLIIPAQAEAAKLPTVGNLPTEGKYETVSYLAPMPVGALSSDAVEQARAEVDQMSWLKLPAKEQQTLVKNIRGKDLMELYRNYGIVRQKELKVYNPPKKLTPDEQVEAENAEAEELLAAVERALDVITLDLSSKTSKLIIRVKPARIKDFLRRAVAVNKALRPLTQRKADKNEAAIQKRWQKVRDQARETARKV